MIMVARRPLSGSSTTPYACASVTARGMIIMSEANTTALVTEAKLRTDEASPDDRRRASCEPCRTAIMTTKVTRAAAHAHAASGRAFQLASASTIPIRGNAAAARAVIELNTMSGFSFDRPPVRFVTIAASRATGFQAPPERLSKAEERLLQDRHHQPVDDRSPGFLRFDEARLLQDGEMGGHGRLRHCEV